MAWRWYIAPPSDPNGNAGKVIWTDDAGNFQIGGNNPETGQPPNSTSGTPQQATTPSVSGGAGAGSIAGAVGGLVDPNAIKALMDLASQNAQQAYLNARLELEKQSASHQWTQAEEQLAQNAAHDAWQKTVAEQSQTGYTGGIGDVAQRVTDAWNRLPAAQKTGANATAIWQSQVPGLTADEAARMAEAGHQYAAINGVAMPADIMQQTLSQITGGRITGQGTPTLAREQQQTTTGLGLLQLASQLRGPDNAFAYARTLQNVPQAMRDQLNAMMQRAGISYTTPGLGATAGQLVGGNLGGATQTGTSAMTSQGLAPYGGLQPAAPGGMLQANGTSVTAANPFANETDAQYQARAQAWAAKAQAAGVPADQIQQQLAQDAQNRTAQRATTSPAQSGGNYMTYTGPSSPSSSGVTGQPGTPQTNLSTGMASGTNYLTSTGGGASPGGTTGAGQGIQSLAQYSPQQWNNTNEYVKRLMLAGLQAGGADPEAEQSAYQMSLPKYGGPTSATVRA